MRDPIEGHFRVIDDDRPPSERQPWKTILDIIEGVVTVVVFAAIMVPVTYAALLISRAVFPTGPL